MKKSIVTVIRFVSSVKSENAAAYGYQTNNIIRSKGITCNTLTELVHRTTIGVYRYLCKSVYMNFFCVLQTYRHVSIIKIHAMEMPNDFFFFFSLSRKMRRVGYKLNAIKYWYFVVKWKHIQWGISLILDSAWISLRILK